MLCACSLSALESMPIGEFKSQSTCQLLEHCRSMQKFITKYNFNSMDILNPGDFKQICSETCTASGGEVAKGDPCYRNNWKCSFEYTKNLKHFFEFFLLPDKGSRVKEVKAEVSKKCY